MRLTPRRLAISRLLSPSLRSCFISGTSLPAVMGRPCGFPSFLAYSIPAFTRSRKISRSNSANTASIPVSALPLGVVRSSASHRDNESHVECVQFSERVHQVHQRPPLVIQAPDQDEIDLPPSGRLNEPLPLGGVSWPQTPRLELRQRLPNTSSLHSPALQRVAWAVSSGRGLKPERRSRRGALSPPVQPPLRSGVETRRVFRGLGMR